MQKKKLSKRMLIGLTAIGPGLFLIGYNIGTGSITTMAKVGAEHGMTLTWALVLSCIFTYVLMVAYGKTTLVSGQTALSTIKSRLIFGKPLAIYIFSKNKKNVDYILKNTYAGGGCINDVLTQFIHPNLPFGGVNHSGIGNAHGFAGFKAFSHEQAIVRNSKFSTIKLVSPPYNRLKRLIIEVVYRYL